MCFELAAQIMTRLNGAVSSADEVQGFRHLDQRDVLGFVDGTENPAGNAAADAVFIGGEDPAFAGGSYVIVQKYLHNLKKRGIISRPKLRRKSSGARKSLTSNLTTQ